MTRTETAWKPISDHWILHGQTVDKGSESELRLRDVLRQLQDCRLPVAAIELIGDVARYAYQSALENSWCDECGLRGDGMTECASCKKPWHHSDLDSVSELCPDCQDSEEE